MGDRLNLDWRIDATNVLNRVTYTGVNTLFGSPQFGLPNRTNTMRSFKRPSSEVLSECSHDECTTARKHEDTTDIGSCCRAFVGSRPDRQSCGSWRPVVVVARRAQQPRASSGPTFRSGTRLIVETVSVKDKDGKPIEGLTAKDFTVTEDGEPQTISFVEFQRLQNRRRIARQRRPRQRRQPPPATAPAVTPPAADLAPRRPATSGTATAGCWSCTSISTALPPPDLLRACAAARKFIDTQMEPPDLLAIMAFKGGAVRVKQDFTDNRAQLREVIQDLIFGEDKDGDGIPDIRSPAPPSARTMASSTSSTPIASCRRCRRR